MNQDGEPIRDTYEMGGAREFRYHPNPRGRFMARDLDPNDPQEEWSTIGAEHWTDPLAGLRRSHDTAMPQGDSEIRRGGQNNPVIGVPGQSGVCGVSI